MESAEAETSRRAGPASGVPKAASKKPRLPAEMVQKIVTKAVEQRQTERRGASPLSSPTAASKATAPSARRAPASPGAWSAAQLPGSPITHAPAATPIGFDEFLKLQEQEASSPSAPQVAAEAPGRPPFNTGDVMGDVDPAAAAAAARARAKARAPHRRRRPPRTLW